MRYTVQGSVFIPAEGCAGLVLAGRGLSGLLVFPSPINLRPKFRDHVAQNAEPCLGEGAVTTCGQQVVVRSPRAGHNSRAKGGRVERKLEADLGFRPVVGDEVSGNGMTRAKPEAVATATVVTRFVPEQPVAKSAERVLDDKLTLARSHTLPVPRPAVAPGRRMIVYLVIDVKQGFLVIDPVRSEARADPQMDSLMAVQRS